MVIWAVAQAIYPGEQVSGDAYTVQQREQAVLLAVIDGLGHGPKAAEAAQRAVHTLAGWAGGEPAQVMRLLDDRLRGTRGAAVSLAVIEGAALMWLGVGNVSGVVLRAADGRRDHLRTVGGIVGYRLPSLRPEHHRLNEGDRIVLATDGVQQGFIEAIHTGETLQASADRVLAVYRRKQDDALILIGQFSLRN